MIKHKRVSTITEYLRDSEKELLNEEERRKECYLKIAEHLWNAEGNALKDGNFELYETIAKTYEGWLNICLEEGML